MAAWPRGLCSDVACRVALQNTAARFKTTHRASKHPGALRKNDSARFKTTQRAASLRLREMELHN